MANELRRAADIRGVTEELAGASRSQAERSARRTSFHLFRVMLSHLAYGTLRPYGARTAVIFREPPKRWTYKRFARWYR
jgi:hypothetical protein